jgi:exopolysaccharide production protein ExoQ
MQCFVNLNWPDVLLTLKIRHRCNFRSRPPYFRSGPICERQTSGYNAASKQSVEIIVPRTANSLATWAIRATLLAIILLSFANFVGSINETLTQGLPYLQQTLGLTFWILVLYASCFIPPMLRVGRTPDMVVAFAFFGFVVLSVAWSNHSSDSVMKFAALLITTIGVTRLACRMSLDAIMGCTIIGLFILTFMSLVVVVFFPDVGVSTGWMEEGLWQGIFDSKQSLGLSGALLMFLACHNALRRGGMIQFLVLFGLGAACVIGSGSKGAGVLALTAIASCYLSRRSPRFGTLLAFGPIAMTIVAGALMAYIVNTGHDYLPWFDDQLNFTNRTVIWEYALRHLSDRALFGFGLNGFWTSPQFYFGFLHEHDWVLDNYHSGYVAILTETGIIGMTLFALCALLFGFRMSWLRANRLIAAADYDLIVGYANLMFLINFSETLFLRSTDFSEALLVAFFIASAGARLETPQPWREPSRTAQKRQFA